MKYFHLGHTEQHKCIFAGTEIHTQSSLQKTATEYCIEQKIVDNEWTPVKKKNIDDTTIDYIR